MQSFLANAWPEIEALGRRAVVCAAIFLCFWIAAKLIEFAINRTRKRLPHVGSLLQLLGQTARIVILVIGAATALGTLGVNVSALVAGLGLTGFALGFAFRDILSNLLSGILLLFFHPFRVGDRIAITGFEGTVASIDLRYTTLTQDDKIILIPNSNLFTNPIVVNKHGVT